MPKVGIMHSGTQGSHDVAVKALKDGLAWGYTGANVTYIERYANDKHGDLDSIAQTLVNTDNVDVLVAAGGSRSAQAAYTATRVKQTPVVFTSVADPARPADNMTGICAQTTKLDAERLKRLSQLLPGKTDFGVLLNKDRFDYTSQRNGLDNQATLLGVNLHYQDILPSSGTPVETQIDAAFQNIQANQYHGALVGADPIFNNHRRKIIAAAETRKIPAIYQWREFSEEGGLISYGPNLPAAYTLAGTYVGQIIAGTTPKKLGVLPLENFELVINLKAAAKISSTPWVPPALLASADRIIV